MATSVLRDVNDNGNVSVFIADSTILFTCEKGHWWMIEASETGSAGPPIDTPRSKRIVMKGPAHVAEGADAIGLARIERMFGPAPLRAMGVQAPSTRRSPRETS